MTEKLKGKVAIVVGGGTGIGEAVAHKFAQQGANVCVFGFPEDPIEDVAASINEEYGNPAMSFAGDAAEVTDVQSAVAQTVERFGKLDVLANVAAFFTEIAETQDFSLEAYDMLLRSNCRSAFVTAKVALPHLQQTHGVIINTGSASADIGEPNATPYGGTKGFIHSFTRGLAHEQAKYGVRVNAVAPGVIETGWTRPETGPLDEKTAESLKSLAFIGRLGQPEEVANVFAFLASHEASFVTGAIWPADGGLTITRGMAGEQASEFMKQKPEGKLTLQHSLDGERNRTLINRVTAIS